MLFLNALSEIQESMMDFALKYCIIRYGTLLHKARARVDRVKHIILLFETGLR